MLYKKSKKTFIHVDCDSFFASCEVLKRPYLKGKKVCVGDEIIIACTYECKKLGVKTGTPIWEAKKLLGKDAFYFKSDHNYYSYISDKIMLFLKENTFNIEVFSIDEAFCDISGLPQMYNISLQNFIKKLQKDILKKIGIPISIGAANTRIKAKIFSKVNKPFGIYIEDEIQENQIFKQLKLNNIPYIGKSSQEKLKYLCETIHDYIGLGFFKVKKELGKNGAVLWLELIGINAFVVKKSKEVKSIGRSRSFNKKLTSNYFYLKNQITNNFEIVFEDITNKNLQIKKINIFLKDKDFNIYNYSYNIGEYTNDREFIFNKIIELFNLNYNSLLLYRSSGVILSDFISYLPKQISIFDNYIRSIDNKYLLSKTINEINLKYNSHKINFGTNLINKPFNAKLGIRK